MCGDHAGAQVVVSSIELADGIIGMGFAPALMTRGGQWLGMGGAAQGGAAQGGDWSCAPGEIKHSVSRGGTVDMETALQCPGSR